MGSLCGGDKKGREEKQTKQHEADLEKADRKAQEAERERRQTEIKQAALQQQELRKRRQEEEEEQERARQRQIQAEEGRARQRQIQAEEERARQQRLKEEEEERRRQHVEPDFQAELNDAIYSIPSEVLEHRAANPGPLYGTRKEPVPLATAAKLSDPQGLVPLPVKMACQWLMNTTGALSTEGLFRIPGSARTCKKYIEAFNTDPSFHFDADEHVVNVCSMLVKYLLSLGNNPLWGATPRAATEFQQTIAQMKRDYEDGYIPVAQMQMLLDEFPAPNRATLGAIAEMLHEACRPEHASNNLMDPEKFALCVTPLIQPAMKVMIRDYPEVFGDNGAAPHESNQEDQVGETGDKVGGPIRDGPPWFRGKEQEGGQRKGDGPPWFRGKEQEGGQRKGDDGLWFRGRGDVVALKEESLTTAIDV